MFDFGKEYAQFNKMTAEARQAAAEHDKIIAALDAASTPLDAAHADIQRQAAEEGRRLAMIEAGAIDGVTARDLAELRAEVDLLRLRTGPAGEAYMRARAAVNEAQAARSQDLRNRRAEMKSKLRQIAAAAEEEIDAATGIMRSDK